jgi:hypothetical protein
LRPVFLIDILRSQHGNNKPKHRTHLKYGLSSRDESQSISQHCFVAVEDAESVSVCKTTTVHGFLCNCDICLLASTGESKLSVFEYKVLRSYLDLWRMKKMSILYYITRIHCGLLTSYSIVRIQVVKCTMG